MSSDDILAAYRAKKERAGDATGDSGSVKDLFEPRGKSPESKAPETSMPAQADAEPTGERAPPPSEPVPPPQVDPPSPEPAPESAPAPNPQPHPEPSAPAPVTPESAPQEAPSPQPEPAPEPAPAPTVPAPHVPSSADAQVDVHPPAAVQEAPEIPSALVATAPGLRLAERLQQDALVMVRGNRTGRLAAGGVAALFLVLLVLERAMSRAARNAGADTGSGLAITLAILMMVAVAVAVGFLFYPPQRKVGVRLLNDQQEEWDRVQGDAQMLRLFWYVGLGAIGAGGLILVLAYSVIPDGGLGLALAFGFLAFFGGLGVTGYAWSRQSAIHRLYVQTLVLSRLEQTGLGPGSGHDPRTAPVLKALDELLGALPESKVRAFLASDAAKMYLEMIDELDEAK